MLRAVFQVFFQVSLLNHGGNVGYPNKPSYPALPEHGRTSISAACQRLLL